MYDLLITDRARTFLPLGTWVCVYSLPVVKLSVEFSGKPIFSYCMSINRIVNDERKSFLKVLCV